MTPELNLLVEIRDGRLLDVPFIMATFLKGLYYGDSWFSAIPKDIFMDNYKKVLYLNLNKQTTVVKIVCLKEDPDVILGYSILSSNYSTIHWVFVKKDWRGKGIAKTLLPSHPTAVTHLTKLGKTLLPKFENCVFNPFLFL